MNHPEGTPGLPYVKGNATDSSARIDPGDFAKVG
jgi:hypothetical protein